MSAEEKDVDGAWETVGHNNNNNTTKNNNNSNNQRRSNNNNNNNSVKPAARRTHSSSLAQASMATTTTTTRSGRGGGPGGSQQSQQRSKSFGPDGNGGTTGSNPMGSSFRRGGGGSSNHTKSGPPPRTYSAVSFASSERSSSSAGRGGRGRGGGGGNGGGASTTSGRGRGNSMNSSSSSYRESNASSSSLAQATTTTTQPSSHSKHHNNSDKQKQPPRRSSSAPTKAGSLLSDVELWHATGMGDTPLVQAVLRHSANALLQHRLLYVHPPSCLGSSAGAWTPHDRCLWKSSNRLQLLEQQQALVYNFKPLESNDTTRWKPKSHHNDDQLLNAETATLDAIQAILNKLSWTNLDKLTKQFLTTLQEKHSQPSDSNTTTDAATNTAAATEVVMVIPPQLIHKVMAQVVHKAIREPHFAPLYARLSAELAQCHKAFRKTLLSQCQEQFLEAATSPEQQQLQQQQELSPQNNNNNNNHAETSGEAVATITVLEKQQAAAESRKRSIGLMTFIGELYVQQLLRGSIVLSCLEQLLVPEDDERLESFCKLLTTTGKRLHLEDASISASDAALRQQLWDRVYRLVGHPERATSSSTTAVDEKPPSTRLKFLLQALIELQDHQWIPIRHEHEKAQTIQQIHQQAALEAQQGPVTKTASTLKRSQSTGGVVAGPTALQKQQQPQRRSSAHNHRRGGGSSSDEDNNNNTKNSSNNATQQRPLRRANSHGVTSQSGSSSLQNALRVDGSVVKLTTATTTSTPAAAAPTQSQQQQRPNSKKQQQQKPQQQRMDPQQCADKFRTVLKEFFISGDRDDAVLSVDEMVAVGRPGHLERGSAIVEAGVLLVLERKESDVRKFIDLMAKLLDDSKLDRACLVQGLRGDVLELLRDIEIDAPLASHYLAVVVAAWLTKKVDDGETALPNLQFLCQAPAHFLTGDSSGRPAALACQILQQRHSNGDADTAMAVVTPDDWQLVEKLMSAAEQQEFETPQKFWQAQQQQNRKK